MEEQLKTIEEGFKKEKFFFFDDVRKRIDELNQYTKTLDLILQKLPEVSSKHKRDVSNLLAEKVSVESEISNIRQNQSKEQHDHDVKIGDKQTMIGKLNTAITDKEILLKSLDEKVKTVTAELKVMEANSIQLRGVVSAVERTIKVLTIEEDRLKKSIGELSAEESRLVLSVEEEKKTFTRLSNEVAILKERQK